MAYVNNHALKVNIGNILAKLAQVATYLHLNVVTAMIQILLPILIQPSIPAQHVCHHTSLMMVNVSIVPETAKNALLKQHAVHVPQDST